MENVTTSKTSLEDYLLELRIPLYQPVVNSEGLVQKAKNIRDNKIVSITEANISYRLVIE